MPTGRQGGNRGVLKFATCRLLLEAHEKRTDHADQWTGLTAPRRLPHRQAYDEFLKLTSGVSWAPLSKVKAVEFHVGKVTSGTGLRLYPC